MGKIRPKNSLNHHTALYACDFAHLERNCRSSVCLISRSPDLSVIKSALSSHSGQVTVGSGEWQSAMMSIAEVPVPRSAEDHARLERMFVTYHSTVWRILCRRGLSPDVAADAMQETYMIAMERLREIEPNSERAFLIQTALRVAHTLGRKTWRWQLESDMDQRGTDLRDTGDKRADIQLCDLVLSKVHPQLAEVFVLYEVEDLSAAEIATVLDIPPGSVASRLRRARKEFRTVLTTIERAIRREGHS